MHKKLFLFAILWLAFMQTSFAFIVCEEFYEIMRQTPLIVYGTINDLKMDELIRALEGARNEFSDLDQMTDDDLAAVDVRLTGSIRASLTPAAAVAARVGYGGTAPVEVKRQIARLSGRLDIQRNWAESYTGPAG